MRQKRDLHRWVRVVYRACRRKYGKDRTQDECLKVFKIVFPVLYNTRQGEGGVCAMDDATIARLDGVFNSWNASGELKALLDEVASLTRVEKGRDEFIAFCEDIIPVAMRIRKLTPRECFRLMDVDESDIDKIQAAGVSNSGQYKLAGNSIVESCLFHIFRKLYIETEPDRPKGQVVQTSLFGW